MKFTLLAALSNVKIWGAVLLLNLEPLYSFINKYLTSDIGFMKWLILVMILDLATGVGKVIKTVGFRGVTSRGLRDTISKCIQYGSFVIVTHVLTHFEINGQVQMTDMQWFTKLAYEFAILIEIKSVYENIVVINPKLDVVQETVTKILNILTTKKEKEDK